MLNVRYKDLGEIRMGSPFNLYEIQFTGPWIPDIDRDGWQNVHAKSPDGRYLVLSAWDTTDNQPGFILYLIDTLKQSFLRTDTFGGACTKLEWREDGIYWEAWHISEERSGTMPLPPK